MKQLHVPRSLMLKSIFFATDFSAASMQALPYATDITRRLGEKLYIAHVVPPEDYPSSDPNSLDQAVQEACRKAESELGSVRESAAIRGIACEALVGSGDIWFRLTDLMRQHGADLLVMGTTGRRGLRKLVLGSVAEEAIRESTCPVLTVGPTTRRVKEIVLRHVLYATDFSQESLAAAPYAWSFSEKYDARLTFLHALEGLPESPYLDAQTARVRLQELATQRAGLAAKPDIVVEMGSPAEIILKTADDAASDLIVIGARGAGAFARAASHFGSVAHKIVCRAPCPVITVRRRANGGATLSTRAV